MTEPARQKRILFIIPNLTSGGAEKILSRLANGLTDTYSQLHLTTLRNDKEDFYPLDSRIVRHRLSVMGLKSGKIRKAIGFFGRFRKLRKTILEINPDLVVSFMDYTNIYTLLALKGLSYPVIISERNPPDRKKIGFPWNVLRRRYYPKADKLVSLSKGVSDCFTWIPEDRKQVIYNFYIREDNVQPDEFPFDSDKKYIAAMGRLVDWKGHRLMIEAFSKLNSDFSEWRLIIFGEGPERKNLEALIREKRLEERVFLPGLVNNPESTMKKADLFVHASYYEGFGNVLVEAMLAGLPIVSTDCLAGPREIVIHNNTGLLVETGNIDAVSEGLKTLMEDSELRSAMSANALESVKRFSFDTIKKQWIDLFDNLMEHK